MFKTLVIFFLEDYLACCQVWPAGAMSALLSLSSSDVDTVNQLEFNLVFLGSSTETKRVTFL